MEEAAAGPPSHRPERRQDSAPHISPDHLAGLISAADVSIGLILVAYGFVVLIRGLVVGTVPVVAVLLSNLMGSLLLYSSSPRASSLAPTLVATAEVAAVLIITYNSSSILGYLVVRREALLMSEGFVTLVSRRGARVAVGVLVTFLAVLEIWRSVATSRNSDGGNEENEGRGRAERDAPQWEWRMADYSRGAGLEEPLLGRSSAGDGNENNANFEQEGRGAIPSPDQQRGGLDDVA